MTWILLIYSVGYANIFSTAGPFKDESSCVAALNWAKSTGADNAACFLTSKPHANSDKEFEREAEAAARETDAEMCKKATEAWQRKAFCKENRP